MREGFKPREVVAGAVLMTGALLAANGCADTDIEKAQVRAEATTTTAEATTTAAELCADTWPMPGLPTNEKHRILVDGLPQLGDATNEAESRDAVADWFTVISQDSDVLASYASTILNSETKLDAASMVDAEGCATDVAEQARIDAQMVIATSTVSAGSVEIPSDVTNTGMNAAGEVVASAQAGISGDRIGVTVETADGRLIAFLRRCGNLAVRGPVPHLPEGPTDEPGVTPKEDKNTTPAGVPGQNRGSGTTEEPGPRGPGKGPAGQTPNPETGFVPGEVPVPAPVEEKTPTDNNSKVGVAPTPTTTKPTDIPVVQNPNQGGNGTPAAPATTVAPRPNETNPNGQPGTGQGGSVDPNNI